MPVSRRSFLQGLGAAGALGVAGPAIRTTFAFAGDVDHTVIVVFLRGGMDGCSAVVPASDPAYHDLRPSIAVPESAVLGIDGGFGLHPAMSGLHRHYQAGRLAIVPAAGSDSDTRSHFEQQAHVERGSADRSDGTGWLTRHLRSRPGAAGPIDVVAFGGRLPASLAGPSNAIATAGLDHLGLRGWSDAELPGARAALTALYGAGAVADSAVGDAARNLFRTIDLLEAAAPAEIAPEVPYPETRFAHAMQQVGQLLRAGLGIDVVTLDMGGFDTHTGMGTWEKGRMRDLLAQLSDGLAAFADDMGAAMDRITVVVQSEFGRRVGQNAGGGCDHGRGGVMMVLGDRVRGGVYGAWPGLDPDALDRGDVAWANDYRHVLSEVLTHHQGNHSMATVFPGYRPEFLGLTR